MRFATLGSISILTATFVLGLLFVPGQAGDKKDGIWKNILSPEVYKELVNRELKTVQKAIGSSDEKEQTRGKVAALMIVSLSLSAKEGDKSDLEGVRAAALRLAEILGEKDKAAEAKKLADAIAAGKGDASLKAPEMNFKKIVSNDYDLMVMYMSKDKGGDGLPEDLQISSRLKGTQEYIENLFSYLSKTKKTLLEKNFKKAAADELALLALRTAVSAELIHSYVPKTKSKTRDPELWVKSAVTMRESALDLAEAAKKQNLDQIQKASTTLLDSCVQCHKMFQ